MNCPKCGAVVAEGVRQCPKCTTAIEGGSADATWAGSASAAAAKSVAADDLTDAGFSKPRAPRPQVASDVLTPPPGFVDRPARSRNDETWAGGSDSPTYVPRPPAHLRGETPTPTPGQLGPNAPTFAGGGWGAAAAPAFTGQVDFGPRYTVEKLLGQGGMGAVYKAYDHDLDRTVALKLVKPELSVHPEAMARFRQELLLASKISHKNILRIHDLGDAGGMKFISMAYVDGEDLHHLLKREGRLPLPRMLNIARQLCAALDAAHSENVVHRDLKPQNILLGHGDLVQVSDFGLAKSIGAETGMTQSGEMLGTPRYMAPEQVEAKTVDGRTDIYALGLIFYEMVTGDVPFTAETTLQLMYKRAHETPPPPNKVVPDLPLWLNNVIVKCLECSPAARYQSSREILADLEAQRGPDIAPQKVELKLPQVAVAVHPGKFKLVLGIAAVAIVLLACVLTIPALRHRVLGGGASAEQAQPSLKSVAVLPLKVSGDSSQDMITADGIVDALSAKLFQLKDIHLASPNDVARLKTGMSPEEIGKALGVTMLVTGTYQAEGDKFQLILNLDDLKSGKRLWTKPFPGLNSDVITIEDNVYNDLISALNVTLDTDERTRTSLRSTSNVTAYESYLRGRNALRGKFDAASAETALGHFERAIKEDPDFALAYAGVADASLLLYKKTNDSKWAQKAGAAAERAGHLGPNIPEVHFAVGDVYSATGKSNEAIAEINEALHLAPNSDDGYRRLGAALFSSDATAAVNAYQKAVDINPYYWFNHNSLAFAYYRLGKDDKAIAEYKKAIEVAPDIPTGYANVGAVYERESKWDDAIAQYQIALQKDPNYATGLGGLGYAYYSTRRYKEAADIWARQVALAPNDETATGNLGDAYRWAGDKQKASATYDKAIELAQKALQVNPRDAQTMGSLALYFAKKGDAATAQQYIRRARAADPNNVDLIYIQGIVAEFDGRHADAIKILGEALQKGYPIDQAKSDPELAGLTSQPEFARLLTKSK